MRVANISLINLEGQILNENVLINVNYHPTYIKEHNIYYIEYTDGRVFVLDLNTNKSYVLENPDKVDIYTLLEANNK
jgi:hypothetical protein